MREYWERLPALVKVFITLTTVASASFAGGALSAKAVIDLGIIQALPARVAAHDEAIEALQEADVENNTLDEVRWLYLACRLDSNDGECEWLLPPELARRLREIRFFIQSAPVNVPPDSPLGGIR